MSQGSVAGTANGDEFDLWQACACAWAAHPQPQAHFVLLVHVDTRARKHALGELVVRHKRLFELLRHEGQPEARESRGGSAVVRAHRLALHLHEAVVRGLDLGYFDLEFSLLLRHPLLDQLARAARSRRRR